MARVLVTGGAGYIGSHTCVALSAAGHEPVVVDSLVNSCAAAVDAAAALAGRQLRLHVLDCRDEDTLDDIMRKERPDAVCHLAGLKSVPESVRDPLRTLRTNLDSTTSLLACMQRHGVHRIVFSSSAAVYGQPAPEHVPVTEDSPLLPVNPYGWSKLLIEQLITALAGTDLGWRAILLRYFNPVGAHPSGQLGEHPSGQLGNLMPMVMQAASGHCAGLPVYGLDHPTPDGSAVRDFIHIMDLAQGHVAALEHLERDQGGVDVYNLGTGQPVSVLELVEAVRGVTGRPVPMTEAPRRPGDPSEIWADPSKARTELGWEATAGVEDMCRDAWSWHTAHPEGYADHPSSNPL